MLSECNKSLSRPRDVGTWWRSSYTIFGLIGGVPRRAVERASERAGERPTFPTAPRRPPTHKTCGEAGGRRPGSSPPPPTSPPVRSSYCTAVAAFSSGIVGGGDGDGAHPGGGSGPSRAVDVLAVTVCRLVRRGQRRRPRGRCRRRCRHRRRRLGARAGDPIAVTRAGGAAAAPA